MIKLFDHIPQCQLNDVSVTKHDSDTILYVGKTHVMSDNEHEANTNKEFCERANGKVLIAGLGLGYVLHNIRDKIDSGKIETITIIEKNKDIIDLIYPYYITLPLNIINSDIFEWVCDEMYDTIYFDIWDNIDIHHLDEMIYLHNTFDAYLNKDNANYWMNSWYMDLLIEKN